MTVSNGESKPVVIIQGPKKQRDCSGSSICSEPLPNPLKMDFQKNANRLDVRGDQGDRDRVGNTSENALKLEDQKSQNRMPKETFMQLGSILSSRSGMNL